MTKTLILITLIVLIYLYWKYRQTKTLQPDDIIERKDKQTFWDASDFDINSDKDN